MEAPQLLTYCLGPAEVHADHRRLGPWPGRRAQSLYAFLLLHRGRPVAREVLMCQFWPHASEHAARNNLNVTLHALRRHLSGRSGGLPYVHFVRGCYALNPDLEVWVDAEEFERLAAGGRRAERAGDHEGAVRGYHAAEVLYRGDLFADSPYDEWLLPQRRALRAAYLDLQERIADHALRTGDIAACAAACQRILALEPCSEPAHQGLMLSYARQGHAYLALRQYQECVDVLRRELDTDVSAETWRLRERIRLREPV